jgi:hypothetical protein
MRECGDGRLDEVEDASADASSIASTKSAEALNSMKPAQARAYDEAVDFASGAILMLNLNPNLKPFFLAQARRAIELRRGGVDSGRHYVRAIAAGVLTEITERGTRRLATHLSTRGKIRDDVIEEVEARISGGLRQALDLVSDLLVEGSP